MANHVLQLDCSTASTAGVIVDTGSSEPEVWVSFEASFSAALLDYIAGLGGATRHPFFSLYDDTETFALQVELKEGGTDWAWDAIGGPGDNGTFSGSFTPHQAYFIEVHVTAGSPYSAQIFLDGDSWGSITPPDDATGFQHFEFDAAVGAAPAGSRIYIERFRVGTTRNGSDVVHDNFEGSLPGIWNEFYLSDVASIISSPTITPPSSGGGDGSVVEAGFSGTPMRGVAPLDVTFTDESVAGPSGPLTVWAWDFGDAGTSSSQNPAPHTYVTANTDYEVMLTATGTSPDSADTADKVAYITTVSGDVVADFTATPTSGTAPLEVTFTDTSTEGPSGPIGSWDWDFGDGDTDTVQNPVHTYADAGAYTVTLTIVGTGGDGTDSVTKVAYVDTTGEGAGGGPALLGASFTGTPTSGATPLSVTFTDTSTPGPSGPITHWSWHFGDGITSTQQNPTHVYTTTGTFTVKLTITGTGIDGTDSSTRTAYIVTNGDTGGSGGGAGGGAGRESGSSLVGRVLIAFDDGPLESAATWTALDQGGDFPAQFVAGYDLQNGRQTLLSQTDTGTATVYINDHEQALFDPRNTGSPYFGKLDGRQIALQLYDPVREVWESQFQGHIDQASYDIDGSSVDANGDPINASIQLNCVDIFDFLAGFGLTPGLDGVTPRTNPGSGNTLGSAGDIPSGGEDGVWYAATTDTVWDRIFQVLMDVTNDDVWVADSAIVFSGNVSLQAVKYDPDESALVALRDACDAEFPFIANMYVDRFGRFVFHGRYARLDPFAVAADAGTERWDFHYWLVGDGKAIQADADRAQMRILGFSRGRQNVINVAIAYPKDMQPANMPNQVFANTASITGYGKHAAPPMSDLLTHEGSAIPSGFTTTANEETFLFAKFLVLGQKDPRETITALQVKSVNAEDHRAATTWLLLTQADVSDMLNAKVGYPEGTGFSGDSPADDYFVEGRQMRVRPLNPDYDYVEVDLELSPAVWSQDINNVFMPRGSTLPGGEAVLEASFTWAQ